jgi:hypothetical protein
MRMRKLLLFFLTASNVPALTGLELVHFQNVRGHGLAVFYSRRRSRSSSRTMGNVRHEQPIGHPLPEILQHGRLTARHRDREHLALSGPELDDVSAVPSRRPTTGSSMKMHTSRSRISPACGAGSTRPRTTPCRRSSAHIRSFACERSILTGGSSISCPDLHRETLVRAALSLPLAALMHDPRAFPRGDPRRRPAHHRTSRPMLFRKKSRGLPSIRSNQNSGASTGSFPS